MVKVRIDGVELSGLLDTGSQVTLMQQQVLERHFPDCKLGVGGTPAVLTLKAANGLEIPYIGYAVMNFEVGHIKIPNRGVVIVKNECSTNPLILGMNVISACWETLFQKTGGSTLPGDSPQAQKAWSQAFATCRRISVSTGDLSTHYVRPASRQKVRVPAFTEVVIWGRARMGPKGTDYCGLVEALPHTSAVGTARTVVTVRKGRLPVRVCNPHPYSLSIGRYQKLGTISQVEETDLYGKEDLSLTQDCEGVVQVGVVEASEVPEDLNPDCEVNNLVDRPDLTEQQRVDLGVLLNKWSNVFAANDDDFGRTGIVQHRIPTGDAAPIRDRFRPLPPTLYKDMKTLLAGMLKNNVIRESSSPWASPIVLVRKKDGSLRFCVDYRKLNSVTHKDAFPLPRIEETLTTLNRAEWFSTLDLASGYWQVEMDPQDREKTAFTTPLGLFEFDRMPFGLCNAPATFQRLMQRCLGGQLTESLLVYLDDIIVYSNDFSSHLQHLEEVFKRSMGLSMDLKPANVIFCRNR